MPPKKKTGLLNPKYEPLTVEKLREFTPNLNLSDEEAEKAVASIRLFAKILYGLMKKKNVLPAEERENH